MVLLSFSFLLGIHNEHTKDERKRKNREKSDDEEEEEESKYEEVEVSKAEFCSHIEYSLEPGKANKSVDVVCWEQAAKIYFESLSSAIVPFQTKNLTWIYFQVRHYLKWSLDEVFQIRSHNIKITISSDNSKLENAAKTDKPNKFYKSKNNQTQRGNVIEKPLFSELKETIEDLETNHSSFQTLRDTTFLHTNFEKESHSKRLTNILLTLSSDYQNKKENTEPTYLAEVPPPLVDLFQREPAKESITGKREKTKAKSEKQPDEKTKNKIEFFISGEELLSGQKLLEKLVKYNSEKVPYVVCLCEPQNVLASNHARLLKPLCITINRLDNLPVKFLQSKGIQHVKFRFLVCDRFLSESNPIPVNDRIKLTHARCLFTNEIDQQQLIQFLQTEGLTVELIGVSKTNPSQGESGASTIKLKKRDSEQPEEKHVYIGTMFADISFILFQPHRIRLTCSICTTRKNDEAQSSKNETVLTNTHQLNCHDKERNKKEKEKAVLLGGSDQWNTTVTVTVALAYPLTSVYKKVVADTKLFNRLVAIFRKSEFAIPIITMINSKINNEILGAVDRTKMSKNFKRPLSKYYGVGKVRHGVGEACITGFSVDCVDFVVIYAESSVSGNLQHLWALASCLRPEQARLLYDSSLVFAHRFYDNLVPLGGFLATALKEPINIIMANSKSYNLQNISRPVRTALTKLHLLSKTTSIRSAVQNQLFPDTNALLSLALEYGTPIQCSTKS